MSNDNIRSTPSRRACDKIGGKFLFFMAECPEHGIFEGYIREGYDSVACQHCHVHVPIVVKKPMKDAVNVTRG